MRGAARKGGPYRDSARAVPTATLSFIDTARVLPVDRDVDVLEFLIRIREDAPIGTTEMKFLDGAPGLLSPVENTLIAGGRKVTPKTAGSFVFVNGRVNIIPDGSPFIRGDSNSDATVDLSDAQFTLNHLFLGGMAPLCADAADSNDDGAINISDPIFSLQWLFLGGRPLPAPTSACGADPTGDALRCASFPPCAR